MKKPIIVHSRNAEQDTLKILKENVPSVISSNCRLFSFFKDWKIHLHCFNDSANYARQMLSEFPNLFIGFTGAITFQSASKTRDIIKNDVPLERSKFSLCLKLINVVLLETDGPV